MAQAMNEEAQRAWGGTLVQRSLFSELRALLAAAKKEWIIFRRYPSWVMAFFVWPVLFPLSSILRAKALGGRIARGVCDPRQLCLDLSDKRIAAVVDPVHLDLRPHGSQVEFQRALLGVVRGGGELRDDRGRKHRHDDHHDQHLDQRETAAVVSSAHS